MFTISQVQRRVLWQGNRQKTCVHRFIQKALKNQKKSKSLAFEYF
jgi:hypothetical protein